MEKKELKWYDAPAVEVVEMKMSAPLLVESNDDTEDKPWWQ